MKLSLMEISLYEFELPELWFSGLLTSLLRFPPDLEAPEVVAALPVALSFCFDFPSDDSASSGKVIIQDCSTIAATRFSYSRRFSLKK
jgi:hypothetical protein